MVPALAFTSKLRKVPATALLDVVTVTVTVAGPELKSKLVTVVADAKVAVRFASILTNARVTVPVNPSNGVRVTVIMPVVLGSRVSP